MIHHYNGGHRLVVVIFFKSSGKWAPRSCSCGPWCRSTIVPGWASCSYPPGSRRPQSKICIIIGILLAVSENMYTYIYIHAMFITTWWWWWLLLLLLLLFRMTTLMFSSRDPNIHVLFATFRPKKAEARWKSEVLGRGCWLSKIKMFGEWTENCTQYWIKMN